MTDAEKEIVREVIAAADALMEAMYNNSLEASWAAQDARWAAAQAAAGLILDSPQP